MKSRSILRKYAAIVAFVVCCIVPAFGKGAVIGYVWGEE